MLGNLSVGISHPDAVLFLDEPIPKFKIYLRSCFGNCVSAFNQPKLKNIVFVERNKVLIHITTL